jgi:transmembrane sensor
MKVKNIDNNYLAKWLNDEMTDAELAKLVGDSDFEAYNRIKLSLDLFESPSFDSEKVLNSIKAQTESKKPKAKLVQLIPSWVYSAAASVALLLAAYIFFFSETTLSTNFGQQTAFNLIDGSFVKLNAKSTLSYNKRTWKKNRVVNLKGEAYFEVAHGSTFTVKTKSGNIVVLGTHFNVKTGDNYLKVTCFEGKVAVIKNNKRTILTKGTSLQITNDEHIKEEAVTTNPSWMAGINTYKNTPLGVIVRDLESQFHISIDTKNLELNKRLTASFGYNNVNLALKSIFIPLNLNYTLTKDNEVRFTAK